jgi:magnesium transporter
MQSMSITLQTLHTQRAGRMALARALRREFVTAVLLGLSCGSVVGCIAGMWKGRWALAATIGLGIALSVVTACLLGVLLPSVVRRFRADPKLASGPIVLATADVATLLFYFNLAGMILG